MIEQERQTFLQGVAQYRYLMEPRRYNEAVQMMAQSYYENASQRPEIALQRSHPAETAFLYSENLRRADAP